MAHGIVVGCGQPILKIPGHIKGGIAVAHCDHGLAQGREGVAVGGRGALGHNSSRAVVSAVPHQINLAALAAVYAGVVGCQVGTVLERDAAAAIAAPAHEGTDVGEVAARDASVEEATAQCGGRAGGVTHETARMGAAARDGGRHSAVLDQVGLVGIGRNAAHEARRVDAAANLARDVQVLDGGAVHFIKGAGVVAA